MEKRSTVDNTMILFDRVTKAYETGQKALDDVKITTVFILTHACYEKAKKR